MGQAFRSPWYPFPAVTDAAKMAERVLQFSPASDAEALKLLRVSFPNCPLSVRVAALDLLMRRRSRGAVRGYMPR
jgi:hypothetical protein